MTWRRITWLHLVTEEHSALIDDDDIDVPPSTDDRAALADYLGEIGGTNTVQATSDRIEIVSVITRDTPEEL